MYTPPRGGSVTFTFVVKDEQGLINTSKMTLHIAGATQRTQVKTQKITQEQITLIPSKKEYNPVEDKEGEVLIQAPFSPAEGTPPSFFLFSLLSLFQNSLILLN